MLKIKDWFHKPVTFASLQMTSDVHTHILPGVDDGSPQTETSVAILRGLQQRGIRKVVFTPHIMPELYDFSEQNLRNRYEDFVKALPPDITLQTKLCAEYFVDDTFIERIHDNMLCFDDRSILIEMSYFYRSRTIRESIFELNVAGYRPILAHPERYGYYQDCPADMDEVLNLNCRYQLNIQSLIGAYGLASVQLLEYLLDRNVYSFIASDIHQESQFKYLDEVVVKSKYVESIKRLIKNNENLFA